ncbi:hypothetical protein [Engelhardtia mirabilis]|uniref:Uncharacterized protein n=1 Tax=Engelhardtia mirabilis TaxID=2528011 RepID=A0A518BQF5_9BACT|nr:hypothetical protein Pla133_43220 [Planctomycetes bacterium Pla133]QDV03532.1 hypothetical protein Pla86_43210 [Planctomycetes bacterium Pla86]
MSFVDAATDLLRTCRQIRVYLFDAYSGAPAIRSATHLRLPCGALDGTVVFDDEVTSDLSVDPRAESGFTAIGGFRGDVASKSVWPDR